MPKKTSFAMKKVGSNRIFLWGILISTACLLFIAYEFGVLLIGPMAIMKNIPNSFSTFTRQRTDGNGKIFEKDTVGNQVSRILDEDGHEDKEDAKVEGKSNELMKNKGKHSKHKNTLKFENNKSNTDNPTQDKKDFVVSHKRANTNNSAKADRTSIIDDSSYDEKSNYLKRIAKAHHFNGVDCKAIFDEDKEEIERARQLREGNSNYTGALRNNDYLRMVKNCSRYLEDRGYVRSSLTQEEKDFPIAYSIMLFTDIEMFERLLLTIYRPQNIYCLHVDAKVDDEYFKTVTGIADCLPNVFLASKRVEVYWGSFSVLEPELVCMSDLWEYPDWKYLINLTGQEFALRTNLELVQILKALKGANCVKASLETANRGRWRGTVPLNIQPVKGSLHIAVTRAYVDYVLHNLKASVFLEWAKGTDVPDETFFQTLNYNPHLNVPGSYNGSDLENIEEVTRYKYWPYDHDHHCDGPIVRWICILRLETLPLLGRLYYMFANKFYLEQDRIVIGCLEEKIFNDTRDGFLGIRHFNTTPYSKLDFVKNHIPS